MILGTAGGSGTASGGGDQYPPGGWQAALHQALQRAAGKAVAVIAPDGRLLYLHQDEQLAETVGTAQALRLRQWLEAPEWIADLLDSEALGRAAREGVVCRGATIADDDESLLEQTIVPLAGANPGPVLVAIREMSDWRRYAVGVERLSRFYEVMLNTAAEGIVGIGAAGCIDFANPAAATLLGWAVEDLLGQPMAGVLGANARWPLAEGAPGEARFTRCGGEDFIAEFRISPKNEDDARQGAVMVFTDVSARKQAESELQESNRRLRETLAALAATQQQLFQAEKMAAIGRLAAGMAHGINNPIAFIASNLMALETYAEELLAAAGAPRQLPGAAAAGGAAAMPDLDFLRQDIPALIAESRSGIERIARIVQNLRMFSQVDLDRDWGCLDLNAGLESAFRLLEHEIPGGVGVLREMGELPVVECQPGQINQIFLNLLSNALNAVGTSGTLWIRSGCAENRAWVEIADDGCGIAPEHLAHLFEPFFTTHPIGTGTGLGLSIAYGIVKQHGGDLSVESRPGEGAVFRLVLPVKRMQGGCGTEASVGAAERRRGECASAMAAAAQAGSGR